MTEGAMVGWHHQINGHEFKQTPGDSEGQGSLACYSMGSQRVGLNLATEQQQQHPQREEGLELVWGRWVPSPRPSICSMHHRHRYFPTFSAALRTWGTWLRAPVGLTQLRYPSKVSKQQLADSAPQALYPLLIHNPLVKEAQAFQAPEVRENSSFL